jgi:hypothetical protein
MKTVSRRGAALAFVNQEQLVQFSAVVSGPLQKMFEHMHCKVEKAGMGSLM